MRCSGACCAARPGVAHVPACIRPPACVCVCVRRGCPCRPGRPLCVYLLRYDDSFESDRYQASVARERQAFESLIKDKEIMVPPPLERPTAVEPVGAAAAAAATVACTA